MLFSMQGYGCGCTFLPPDAPLLSQKVQEVSLDEIRSQEIQGVIDEMLKVASGERGDIETQKVMVGLAAPQIGVNKRIILVDVGVTQEKKELGSLHVYINPEIVWSGSEIKEGPEGCYSTGDIVGIVPRVPRSTAVRIRALDRQGNLILEEHQGYTARIFQHEIDHLEGIRFPERVGESGKLHWVKEEERVAYRGKWQEWEKICPYAAWLEMVSKDHSVCTTSPDLPEPIPVFENYDF
jgi:peptide deformylase